MQTMPGILLERSSSAASGQLTMPLRVGRRVELGSRNEHTLTLAPLPFEPDINSARGEAVSPQDYIVRMEAAPNTAEHPIAADALALPELSQRDNTVFAVLIAISFCHLLNDMMQSLLPAIYPNLKAQFGLSFVQVGLVTFAYQITASLLQPLVGLYADRRPTPLALPGGTLFTLAGLTMLSVAAQLRGAAHRRLPARRRVVGLPSRVVARGAHGGRRAVRARAVALSSRRQRRLGARAARRRHRRRALGTVEPRGHRVARAAVGRRAVERRPLVQAAWARAAAQGAPLRDRRRLERRRPGDARHRRPPDFSVL